MEVTEKEAKTFTHYLVRRQPSTQAIQLYQKAVQASKPNKEDKKLLQFMVSHPYSIGLIDAGLVFRRPASEARRRLYIMLAILEASPEHADLFLPTQRGPFYVFTVFFSGVRAVIKAGIGMFLVRVID